MLIFLKKYLLGDCKLAPTFWWGGLAGGIILTALFFLVLYFTQYAILFPGGVTIACFLVITILLLFVITRTSIILSALKTKGQNTFKFIAIFLATINLIKLVALILSINPSFDDLFKNERILKTKIDDTVQFSLFSISEHIKNPSAIYFKPEKEQSMDKIYAIRIENIEDFNRLWSEGVIFEPFYATGCENKYLKKYLKSGKNISYTIYIDDSVDAAEKYLKKSQLKPLHRGVLSLDECTPSKVKDAKEKWHSLPLVNSAQRKLLEKFTLESFNSVMPISLVRKIRFKTDDNEEMDNFDLRNFYPFLGLTSISIDGSTGIIGEHARVDMKQISNFKNLNRLELRWLEIHNPQEISYLKNLDYLFIEGSQAFDSIENRKITEETLIGYIEKNGKYTDLLSNTYITNDDGTSLNFKLEFKDTLNQT